MLGGLALCGLRLRLRGVLDTLRRMRGLGIGRCSICGLLWLRFGCRLVVRRFGYSMSFRLGGWGAGRHRGLCVVGCGGVWCADAPPRVIGVLGGFGVYDFAVDSFLLWLLLQVLLTCAKHRFNLRFPAGVR